MPKETKGSQGVPSSGQAGTVKQIRGILGRTQAELAAVLGVSAKAVQSYEQGWRPVPVRVMIQLLVLLALYRQQSMDDMPCWKVRDCPESTRETCPAFTMGRGQFCWFIGCKACKPPKPKKGEKDLLPCMRCPVVRRLLRGPEPGG